MLAHCVHFSVVLGCWNPKEGLVGFVGDKKKRTYALGSSALQHFGFRRRLFFLRFYSTVVGFGVDDNYSVCGSVANLR
jgi:hypothetical protein